MGLFEIRGGVSVWLSFCMREVTKTLGFAMSIECRTLLAEQSGLD